MHTFLRRGFSLVEVVVAVSVIALALVALTTGFNRFLRSELDNTTDIKAILLLEEGMEITRLFRDDSYNSSLNIFTINTPYYFSFNNGAWSATTTPQTYIDGLFDRQFSLSSVYRDSNNDIASLGTIDVNTKKVTVSVSYSLHGATTTRLLSAYFTNLFAN